MEQGKSQSFTFLLDRLFTILTLDSEDKLSQFFCNRTSKVNNEISNKYSIFSLISKQLI